MFRFLSGPDFLNFLVLVRGSLLKVDLVFRDTGTNDKNVPGLAVIVDLKIFYYKTLPVYAAWGQWSSCSETCYPGGEKTRSRTCNQHCENVEDSDLIQTTSCNGHDCPGKKLRIVMLPK